MHEAQARRMMTTGIKETRYNTKTEMNETRK